MFLLTDDTGGKTKIDNQMKYVRFLAWIGTGLGAIGGFLYWKEIGCITGTCPLKSQWQTMIPIGAYFGFVIGDAVKGLIKPDRKNQDTES